MFHSIFAEKGDGDGGGRNQQFGGGATIETQIGANIARNMRPMHAG